jgi:hypothetical protein
MLNIVAVGTMAMSLLAGPASAAQAEPLPPAPADKIRVSVVSANGSGCHWDDTQVAASADDTAFTVVYGEFLARAGGDSNPTDIRKNCQMVVQVHVPRGLSFAVAKVDYRGYLNLARGATATMRSGYYFSGDSDTVRTEPHTFAGPIDGLWQATDTPAVSALAFAPCGEERLVNINAEILVRRGSSDRSRTSFMAMDSADGTANTVFHLAWRPCP